MSAYADVVVEAPVDKVYCYRVPPALAGNLEPGCRVKVPFGNRRVRGFCVGLRATCEVEEARLKEVLEVGPRAEAVPGEILELARWVSRYYSSSWGMCLAAAMPAGIRRGTAERRELHVALAPDAGASAATSPAFRRRAPVQARVLEFMAERLGAQAPGASLPAREVERACEADRAVLKRLARKGLLELRSTPLPRAAAGVGTAGERVTLNPEQRLCVQRVAAVMAQGVFRVFLLHGVTGSGKTEVYLRAMETALARGRGVLVLVPEISLTPQTVERFRARAGKVALMHSHQAAGERARIWRELRQGDVRVVVGPRSAAFAPVRDLGLVIVDEEHAGSFKQENDPRYHGRDVAVVRARAAGATVILGSATPSLESWRNAMGDKYELLRLPRRVGGAVLPRARVVDMRAEWADCKRPVAFSRLLLEWLRETIERKEQAIILLNRRGFNTCLICRSCGEVLKCDDCDVSLTFHRREGVLRCHYCDARRKVPRVCPKCSVAGLQHLGTGTERAEEVLAKVMPGARVRRMDSDTMSGRDAYANTLAAFARRQIDVLLGTQMVAKGFDFPNVTLVGVLGADSGLGLPDFRAAERTFQLVAQVIGRAGRAGKSGRAVIQALDPEHYAVRCALAQDFHGFARHELDDRRSLGYPPFGRLARVLVRHRDQARAQELCAKAVEVLRHAGSGLAVLGPAPCPIERIQGRTRLHALVKARTHQEIARALAALSSMQSASRAGSLVVDVDPISLL